MNGSSPSPGSCPNCGTALPSAGTDGLCPRCLMAEAMRVTEAGADQRGSGGTVPPEVLAPHFPQLEILECLGRGGMGVVDGTDELHEASLTIWPVISSGDPRWVSVMGQVSHNETAVDLRWEILGSRRGLVRFSRAGTPIAVLDPQQGKPAELFGVSARLTLTRLSTNRVLLTTEVRGTTTREEFEGNFRELSTELRRTACLSAKTLVHTPVELCQFQGKSFHVTVMPAGDVP